MIEFFKENPGILIIGISGLLISLAASLLLGIEAGLLTLGILGIWFGALVL